MHTFSLSFPLAGLGDRAGCQLGVTDRQVTAERKQHFTVQTNGYGPTRPTLCLHPQTPSLLQQLPEDSTDTWIITPTHCPACLGPRWICVCICVSVSVCNVRVVWCYCRCMCVFVPLYSSGQRANESSLSGRFEQHTYGWAVQAVH